MKQLINMAKDRGAFICQSQSLNLWMEDPTYNSLTSMHFYSWEQGLKQVFIIFVENQNISHNNLLLFQKNKEKKMNHVKCVVDKYYILNIIIYYII